MLETNPLREGLATRRAPESCAIVLYGATGDLVRRKLMPSLLRLDRAGLLPSRLAIVGFARRPKTHEEFRAEMRAAVHEFVEEARADPEAIDRFVSEIYYQQGDFDDPQAYEELGKLLGELDRKHGLPGHRLHYLAISPQHFALVVDQLGAAGLVREGEGGRPWARVVVEKPFGTDLASSKALNADLLRTLAEEQIYRIDHYLGKETVQNLLAFRFANGIFEPLWNHKYVDHVQITVSEDLGVGSRGGYYDRSGAMRDMVQNHLLQLFTLVSMEPPVANEANAIRDEKVKVLRAVRRIDPDRVDELTARGQYTRGVVHGEEVEGYLEADGVDPASRTETFVAVRLEIENWRWAGTPFLLRSGKRLPKRASEIAIRFRKPPMRFFSEDAAAGSEANALLIHVQPDEGISLRFGSKVPGPDVRIRQVKMDFRYGTSFGVPSPDAYERLLLDVLSGDSTLFTRRDEVEAAWTLMGDVLDGWARSERPPHPYPAGSWGPPEAERLLGSVEGGWRRL